jgi:hypothetical protein
MDTINKPHVELVQRLRAVVHAHELLGPVGSGRLAAGQGQPGKGRPVGVRPGVCSGGGGAEGGGVGVWVRLARAPGCRPELARKGAAGRRPAWCLRRGEQDSGWGGGGGVHGWVGLGWVKSQRPQPPDTA